MKKVLGSSDNKRAAIDKIEKAADLIAEILDEYAEMLGMNGTGILSEDELDELDNVCDMLYDAAHMLGMSRD